MKIECNKLTKKYGNNIALFNFTYMFTPGIYGLLGPNGAGKTTLMNLLTCNLKADVGEILCNGMPIRKMGAEYRKKIGFMPQQQRIYPSFSVERFLFYMAGLKGMKKKDASEHVDRLLKMVNLIDDRKKLMGDLSGGMKQRALLAQALLGKPELIILDEPTAGVDPKERIQMRNIVSKVGSESIILIATHVVSDVQTIAKNILLLDSGKLKECGSPEKLCAGISGKVFEIITDEKRLGEISEEFRIVSVLKYGRDIKIRIVGDTIPKGYEAKEMIPDLEDIYLYHFE